MRILIWTDAFWPEIGGLEVFCTNLALSLRERGHECLILTERNGLGGRGLSDYQGIPVYGVTFYRASLQHDLRSVREQHEACKELIHGFQPEVIHLNSVLRGALGFLLQQRDKRRPALLTLHDHASFKYQEGMTSSVLGNIDGFVAISEFVEKTVLNHQPELLDKLWTVSNALPLPEVAPLPLPAEPRLLAFGRLIKQKGFDLAIEAFAQVGKDYPQATLTVAGKGDEHANLVRQAEASGFAHRIFFPGWVRPEKIPELINQHTLVIMPGRWQEPFGFVALQAAQMGRPIVASRTGALPEIVRDGITGHLFKNENIPALTAALKRLLDDPAHRQRLGEQAQAHARKHFSFLAMVEAYESLYLKLAKRT